MKMLFSEMKQYYMGVRYANVEKNSAFLECRLKIWKRMDEYLAGHPQTSSSSLKACLHETIAENFEPVIFSRSPFFFEMGVRPAENWGCPSWLSAGSWLREKRVTKATDRNEWKNFLKYRMYVPESRSKIWIGWDVFDFDHHCLNYTKLLSIGINGIINEIRERLEIASSPEETDFLESAERSCRSMIRVAARFAEKACIMLKNENDPDARKNLELIVSTAKKLPASPPSNFYEGLAAILFLREATASMESIGISVIGHLDRLLNKLYRMDIQSGKISREDASDMLAAWMLHTDVKFHVDENQWPETSTCIELGGVDADGYEVYSDLTKLIIETHAAHKLLNPKLNCRFSTSSPQEYISLVAEKVAEGHNNFALLNDNTIIPACIRSGKTEKEARLYVNGGCQETIVEGVEHSAGAYFYFNVARVLDLAFSPLSGGTDEFNVLPDPLENVKSFEELYISFIASLKRAVCKGGTWLASAGTEWPDINPCPFFSASLEGCLKNAKDYTAGGAKYNPAGIALVGFGTVVDSLYAVKEAVFVKKWLTMNNLRMALSANWAGYEDIRARMAAIPKFGHGNTETEWLAVRFARDLAGICSGLKNERGGPFQPSLFVYYLFSVFGEHTNGTPDGRHAGDFLSQGISPGRVNPPDSISEIIRAVSAVDLMDFPGNAVLDLQVPLGSGAGTSKALAAVITTFGKLGGATLQPNCVSIATLMDAQTNPDKHGDIIVRISGLSAKYVCLDKKVQDEIIQRYMSK